MKKHLIARSNENACHACMQTSNNYILTACSIKTKTLDDTQPLKILRGKEIDYRIADNFRYLAPALSRNCSWVRIFAVQCQETTPINSFACEILVHGSLSLFMLTALPSKNAHHGRTFPTIYGTGLRIDSMYIQFNL